MRISKMYSILAMVAIVALAFLFPSEVMAANDVGEASSLDKVITNFFKTPLVKGVLMVGAIGGGIYLVLSGFGVLGDGGTDPKKIIFGFILTAIGLGYDGLVAKVSEQFKETT